MNNPFPRGRPTRAGMLLPLVLCGIQVASGTDSWDESRRNGTRAREQGRYAEAKRFLEASPFPPAYLIRTIPAAPTSTMNSPVFTSSWASGEWLSTRTGTP